MFFSAGAEAQVLFQDTFHGTISPAWMILGADTGYYAIKNTELDLRVSSQDIDTGYNNNAKNLFLIPNPATGDFTATLKIISFVPAPNNHAQIDVIAFDSPDNLVRANYGFIKGQRQAEFGTEIFAGWSPEQTPLDPGSGTFFLRLTKTGNSYYQSYSTDGVNYTTINSPRRFGNGSPAYLGFCAGADPSDSSHVHIDSFAVEGTALSPARVAAVSTATPASAPIATQNPVSRSVVPHGTPSLIIPSLELTAPPPASLALDSSITLSIAPAVQITWPAAAGKTYQIQSTTELLPANWTNLGAPLIGTGTNAIMFDATGADGRKFYRVLGSP